MSHSAANERRALHVPLAVLGLVALAYTVGLVLLYLQHPADGVTGNAVALFVADETEFAPGYSEERFMAIEAGMTRAQVLGLLGAPLRGYRADWDGSVWWAYSRKERSPNFRSRLIVFRDERVVDRVQELYLD